MLPLRAIVGIPCAVIIGFQPANQAIEALYYFGYTNIAGVEFRYEKALKEAEEVIEKAEVSPEYRQQNKGEVIAAQALTWKGVDFKKGVSARCADFVREVLAREGITLATPKESLGPLMADSFHAPDEGTIILDPSYLAPGDIVMFSNTYNGGGRILNGGRITHVGIYVGNGMMIDRSTSSRPVNYRPITTFKFNSALRPNAYSQP